MAYAAYREYLGAMRSPESTSFHVLDITVDCADVRRVRQCVSRCVGAGVLRCEPLLPEVGSSDGGALRALLMLHFPLESYAQVVQAVIGEVAGVEIGRLLTWRHHLARCGLKHGG